MRQPFSEIIKIEDLDYLNLQINRKFKSICLRKLLHINVNILFLT